MTIFFVSLFNGHDIKDLNLVIILMNPVERGPRPPDMQPVQDVSIL